MNQHQEDSLDEALTRTADGAFVNTMDGKIVFWNRAAEKILGYTSREALGRGCHEILGGRDEHGNRLCYKGCHVSALVKMGDPVQSFDMQTRTKAGHSVWLNVSILNTRSNQNGPVTIHLFRDVTGSKELLRLVGERMSPPPPPDANGNELTRRELEILRLLGAGHDTKSAAAQLHVSPATVRNHVQNILGKLGVHSRLQAVAYATTHRLL
jgi:PAS domain S-box-containing protein